jgi:hypothetical protein
VPSNPSSSQVESSGSRAANILETLTNLVYLARLEASDPEKVTEYMNITDERLQALAALLKTKVWLQS